jgi:serine/threonine protein phosphatase 1
MMMRPNVYPILGNHEYMALTVLKKMAVEITEDNFDKHLAGTDINAMLHWQSDGGNTTIQKFRELDLDEKEEILEYLQEFSLYEEISVGDKKYVLAHADLHGFESGKCLEDMELYDFIFYRADYTKRYFEDENTVLVTGHTPTFLIRGDKLPLVYEENGHIALDCGCVYGERLAAYCLNDGRVVYVERMEE